MERKSLSNHVATIAALMVLAAVPVVAHADDCLPRFDFVIEAGTTTASTIYAHVEPLPFAPGCVEQPVYPPSYELVLTDNAGNDSAFPLTQVNAMRVRFTPTTYGIYRLRATVANALGETTKEIAARKGPAPQ